MNVDKHGKYADDRARAKEHEEHPDVEGDPRPLVRVDVRHPPPPRVYRRRVAADRRDRHCEKRKGIGGRRRRKIKEGFVERLDLE